MNNIKKYISLLGFFLVQIIFYGLVNLLFKDSFFSKSDLKTAVVVTVTVGIFMLLQSRKSKDK
ncbi:hypothetical protein VBG40_13685 [Vagococcus fluvialis]|uniref:hypothetical protein n=1 Tax=Vagococcus fluvialis TaxID=2738 RepID=UPI003797E4E1